MVTPKKDAKPKKPRRKPKPAQSPNEVPRLSDLERAFCLLSEQKGIVEAGIKLGLDARTTRELQQRGTVKRYQEHYRRAFLKEMARAETRLILKMNVTREDLVSGLNNLAMLPPEFTNGNIAGQVSAYAKIAELLGLTLTPRDADNFFKGRNPEELRNYATYGTFDAPDAGKKSDPGKKKKKA